MGENGGVVLRREKIVDTAVGVLAEFGLADLSMRRLAVELGVAPGALYYHVRNKQELLVAVAVRLMEGATGPVRGAGLAGLGSAALSVYGALVGVRDSVEVVRLALAVRDNPGLGQPISYIDDVEYIFASAASCPDPQLAAEVFTYVCLSLVEQQQTAALLAGATPSPTPPPSYLLAVEAVVAGFCSGRA